MSLTRTDTVITSSSIYDIYNQLNDSEAGSSNSLIVYNRSKAPTNETELEGSVWSLEFSIILATILTIAALLNITGNTMVLIVLIKHRGMRTRTNLFLGNLAVADIFVGVLAMPFSIVTIIQGKWVFGQGICVLNGFMNAFCLITSIHTLMYIAIHKYFSIIYPERGQLELKTILTMMAAAWLWAIVCCVLTVIGLEIKYKRGASQCGPKYPSTSSAYAIHGILQSTVIVGPIGIVLYCYMRMFYAIRAHARRLRDNARVPADRILSQQKKVAVTMFIVLACFIVMALPYHIYATYVTIVKDKGHFNGYINPLAYMFLFLNSMCNPIIYALRSPAFREGYKEIMCGSPNFVVVDESERSGRFSSLMSTLRRASNFSVNNSIIDPYVELTLGSRSDLSVAKVNKSGRSKSIFSLLRSTRQSDAQSVVHRNGDIIIMKRGKIVSVKKTGEISREGSPFLDRLEMLRDTGTVPDKGIAAALAGPGHVLYGISADPAAKDNLDKDRFRDSLGSDDVFHGSRSDLKYAERDLTCNKDAEPFKGDNAHPNNNLPRPTGGDFAEAKRNIYQNGHNRPNKLKSDKPSPNISSESLKLEDSLNPGILVTVDDDDLVLDVMPLTPHTREHLTKSDFYLSHSHTDSEICEGSKVDPKPDTIQPSRSTSHLHQLKRLPSVEYLELPSKAQKSHSASSVNRRRSDTPPWSRSPVLSIGPIRIGSRHNKEEL